MHSDPKISSFYTTAIWRKCRASFLKSKGGLCEPCLSKGLIVPATQVHHKTPITPDNIDDPGITLNFDNLLAVCERCHAEQHHRKRWRCDKQGHVFL